MRYSFDSSAISFANFAFSEVTRAAALKPAIPSAQRFKSHCRSRGIPKRSHITAAGKRKENSETRSNFSLSPISSNKSLTIFSIFGSKAVIDRGVKDLLMRRRKRVCAGGS